MICKTLGFGFSNSEKLPYHKIEIGNVFFTKIVNFTRKDISSILKLLSSGNSKRNLLMKKFYLEIYKHLFKRRKELSPEEINGLNEINKIYLYCFDNYKLEKRKNGEDTIIHLLKTALYIVRNFQNATIRKIKIALTHDIIEDGIASFEEMKELCGNEVALAYLALSKNHISTFFDEERGEKDYIIKSGILNKNWKIKKEIKEKAKAKQLNKNEQKAYDLYQQKSKQRAEEYFLRFESIKSLTEYVKNLTIKKGIKLKEEELDILVSDIFDVKFADRCHNLCTQWDPNGIQKIYKKIAETEEYLLPIAYKINKNAHKLLIHYIEELFTTPIIRKKDNKYIGTMQDINWMRMKGKLKIDLGSRNIDGENLLNIG